VVPLTGKIQLSTRSPAKIDGHERESITFCVTGCLDDAKNVRIVSTDVPPQRSLRGRGRDTGSRNACPNVWAWSEDGVAPGTSSWSTDCNKIEPVGWVEDASPNSIFCEFGGGAGVVPVAASLASLASSILTLISRRMRRTRASPTTPATTNASVSCGDSSCQTADWPAPGLDDTRSS